MGGGRVGRLAYLIFIALLVIETAALLLMDVFMTIGIKLVNQVVVTKKMDEMNR